MTIEYRMAEYGDFDLEAVVQITHAIRPDAYESVADLADWHDVQRNAGRMCVRWLASLEGQVVGSAYVGHSPWMPRTTIILYVAVHPDHQARGCGRALLGRAEATASERGGAGTFSWTEETWPRSMRFLEHAGYEMVERRWESTLDLARCDLSSLQDAVDRVVSSGVRIMSVASFSAERDDWKRDLHRLYADVERDVPAPFPIQGVRFEDFEAVSLGRRFVGDGFFVALDGDELVGLTEPQPVDDVPNAIEQNLTGVRSDYRGRGIAFALKSQAAIWAAQAGYTSIRTQNAQSNAAMLAVNDRLGFERKRATIEYLKNLQ
jgi:GNAT superfamily N-acetyltransferase